MRDDDRFPRGRQSLRPGIVSCRVFTVKDVVVHFRIRSRVYPLDALNLRSQGESVHPHGVAVRGETVPAYVFKCR